MCGAQVPENSEDSQGQDLREVAKEVQELFIYY